MYVSRVNVVNKTLNYKYNSVNNKKVQENPSFQRAKYAAAFAKYFDGSERNASNAKTYEELMTLARRASGAVIDEVAEKYFTPDVYNGAMYSLRHGQEIYGKLIDSTYHKPVWLVRNGFTTVASVFNMGTQGNILDIIFGKSLNDARICFHGLDNYKDCVICLSRDYDGHECRVTSRTGLGTIIGADIAGKL